MSDDDFINDEVFVWADNWLSFCVFAGMSTQWRTSFSGVTGFDYSALPIVMKFEKVKKKYQKLVFEDIRYMEVEALNTILDK